MDNWTIEMFRWNEAVGQDAPSDIDFASQGLFNFHNVIMAMFDCRASTTQAFK